jgi:NDP-mannose synthase
MMKTVILAGGLGTRLAPYTTVFPKPLMPLGNRPILEIVICQLREHGFTDITMAVGYLSHLLHAYFEDGRRFGVNIHYSYEDKPLGTAGPLTLLPPTDDPILVMNGDVLTDLNFSDLYHFHRQQRAAVTVSMHAKQVQIDLGVLETVNPCQVVNYIEKPTYSYRVSMGIYVVEPRVLTLLPKNERVDFPDLIHMLLDREEKVVGYMFNGLWLDIGRPDDFARAVDVVDQLNVPWPSETRPLLAREPVLATHYFDGRA